MITPSFLVRLYGGSSVLAALLCVISMTTWHDWTLVAGLALGHLIGISPFVSWHIILVKTRQFTVSRRGLILALTLGKYGILGLLLYCATQYQWVDTAALMVGIVVPMIAMGILGSWYFLGNPAKKVL